MTPGEVAVIYATGAALWFFGVLIDRDCGHWEVFFTTVFWPLDFLRGLCRGARDWWRA